MRPFRFFQITFTAAFFACSSLVTFAQTSSSYFMLVGTYTKGLSKGIQVYAFDAKTGHLQFIREQPVTNPSYLAFGPGNKTVYAVSEDNGIDGKVSAFQFNTHTGELKPLNTKSSEGTAPCYVTTDHTGKLVFVANYSSGTVAAYGAAPDGSLVANPQVMHDEGSSMNLKRQEHAHAHSTVVSPDNKYLLTADLGTDKEMIYRINTDSGANPLSAAGQPFYKAKAGSGPRHLVFNNKGTRAYLVQELSGTVTTFSFSKGVLDSLQSVSLVPTTKQGDIGAADIHLSPDGKFLYASDRGDYNDISVFAVDQKTGLLSFRSRQSCFGKTPRNFSIAPGGKYLVVANQNSDDLYVLSRNLRDGSLGQPVTKVKVGSPVCIQFVKKD